MKLVAVKRSKNSQTQIRKGIVVIDVKNGFVCSKIYSSLEEAKEGRCDGEQSVYGEIYWEEITNNA